jgi:hypothetical protein
VGSTAGRDAVGKIMDVDLTGNRTSVVQLVASHSSNDRPGSPS